MPKLELFLFFSNYKCSFPYNGEPLLIEARQDKLEFYSQVQHSNALRRRGSALLLVGLVD
jgi:hypothetical protein